MLTWVWFNKGEDKKRAQEIGDKNNFFEYKPKKRKSQKHLTKRNI